MSNQPTNEVTESPKRVIIERRTSASGRGGMCSISYYAVLVECATGRELARTRSTYGGFGEPWIAAAHKLAKRRGWIVDGVQR